MLGKLFRFLRRKSNQHKWRKNNSHNKTCMSNDFDYRFVKVGIGTYGGLFIRNDGLKSHVIIGNYCSIAEGVKLLADCDHPTNLLSTYPFKALVLTGECETISKGDIVIEDDVWIGMNAIILSGVRIGKGSIIGAGSVVAKSIPPYSIVVGNPGRVVKKRFSDELIAKLMKFDFEAIDKKFLQDNKANLYTPLEDDSDLDWLFNDK